MQLSETAKLLVVINPRARRNGERLLADLQDAGRDGWTWTIVETSPEQFQHGALADQAQASDVVVAIGGDGTVTDAMTAIGDVEIPLAILPGGSTNVIAQELGLPFAPEGLASLLSEGYDIRVMDAATCNGRYFLHMAGAGFDSRIFDQANPELKQKVGWFAYLPSAASSLRMPPSRFTITTESASFELTSPMVLVANGAGIVRPSLYVYPGIASDDGWLDLIAVTATEPTAIASVLARFVTRSMDRSPHILHTRSTSVHIEANPPMPVQVDGDVVGMTPVQIEILPGKGRIVVPKGTGATEA